MGFRRQRSQLWAGVIFGGVGLLCILAAVVLLVLASTSDNPGHSYACGHNGTCFDGAAAYKFAAALTGGIGLIFALVGLPSYIGYRRANARAARALASGLTCPGEVVECRATGTKINGRRIYKVFVAGRTPEGDTLQCVEKVRGWVDERRPVTLAYNRDGDVCVVEDLQALRDGFLTWAPEQAEYAPPGSIRISQSPDYRPAPQADDPSVKLRRLYESGALTADEYHAACGRLGSKT